VVVLVHTQLLAVLELLVQYKDLTAEGVHLLTAVAVVVEALVQ
jgi:hypothetical protein